MATSWGQSLFYFAVSAAFYTQGSCSPDTPPATRPCAPETFSFPVLHGSELVSISASPVRNWMQYSNFTPEALKIGSEGISFCNVTVTYTHPGQGDSVNVQAWLPLTPWNDRFVGVGGGGFATGEFTGDIIASLIAEGYAAAATDGGHDYREALTAPWALVSPGNINWNLLINFSYLALHDMTVIGKSITEQFYGQKPRFSYWNGCSTGGRQGLVVAQRYPNDYDGILAGCPAINTPEHAVGILWPQVVMETMGYFPPSCQLEAIVAEAIRACDELDGLKDGVIAVPDRCKFDPMSVVGKAFDCNGMDTTISTAAAHIAKAAWQGPLTEGGKSFWHGYPVGTPLTGPIAVANTVCEEGMCSGIPMPLGVDWVRNFLVKDPSYDVRKMTPQDFQDVMKRSWLEYNGIVGSNDPDLSRFKKSGGKMISWHGVNDELLTVYSTRQYYRKVMKRDSEVHSYYRHFEVPGVNHCHAPLGATYPLHALQDLRRWVEDGVEPEVLRGVRLGENRLDEKRLICPYPLVAGYTADAETGICLRQDEQCRREAVDGKDEL